MKKTSKKLAKRIAAALLACGVLMSVAGCGGGDTKTASNDNGFVK